MNPRIGSGLKYIRRLLVEKAVEQVKNLKGGTKEGFRKAFLEGDRATGDREWTPAVSIRWRGDIWKTPGEAVERAIVRRQRYESVGKDGVKGRGWISQTIKGLWEILSAVATNQQRKLQRLKAAEAKCNELQH